MNDGIVFLPMGEAILNFLDALMGGNIAVNFIFLTGGFGTLVLFTCMPIRIVWHIYKAVRREKLSVSDLGRFFAVIFLFLAFAGTFEVWFVLSQAGPGSSAGMLLPIFLFLPFLLYVVYEIIMFFSNNTRKKIKPPIRKGYSRR